MSVHLVVRTGAVVVLHAPVGVLVPLRPSVAVEPEVVWPFGSTAALGQRLDPAEVQGPECPGPVERVLRMRFPCCDRR